VAHAIISTASFYLVIGVSVALMFIAVIGRIDPAARGAYGFRPLLMPGAILLWPLVIWFTLRAIKRLDRRSSP
jgi:hypothetical protein